MSPKDIEYFRARAAQERDRAASTTDPTARAQYLDLAAKYETLAESASVGAEGGHFGDPILASRNAVSRSLKLLSVAGRQRDAR